MHHDIELLFSRWTRDIYAKAGIPLDLLPAAMRDRLAAAEQARADWTILVAQAYLHGFPVEDAKGLATDFMAFERQPGTMVH